MTKQLLVVLGMHRSGTSALTRGLKVLGVELGENLLAADEQVNAKGFWEDKDILSLNIDIQEALGLRWDNLKPISEEDCQRDVVREFIPRAISLLNKKMSDQSFFGMKDPRISVVLPFWRQVFSLLGVKVHYLIASRNPLSIVNSLAKRDGLIPEHSLQLWQNYMLASLKYTEGESRLVVDFDLLLKDPAQQLERVANLLQLPFSTSSHSFMEFQAEFLDKTLCHAHHEISDLESSGYVTKEQLSLYLLLCNLSHDSILFESGEYEREFNELIKKYAFVKPILTLAGMQSRELIRLSSKLHDPLVYTCLYLDLGQGFSESSVVKKELDYPCSSVKENFILNKSPSSVTRFRLDPINVPCVVKINTLKLKTKSGEIDLKDSVCQNASQFNNEQYYFSTYDPQIIISVDVAADEVILSLEADIEFIALEEDALELCRQVQAQQLEDLNKRQAEQVASYSKELDELNSLSIQQANVYEKKLDELNLVSVLQAEAYEKRLDIIEIEKTKMFESYIVEINELKEMMAIKESEWGQEKEAILRSSSWRLTRPLRNVMALFRRIRN